MGVQSNLHWGLRRGFGIGVGLSLIASLLFVLRGAEQFEDLGVTFLSVVATYLAGGIVGGIILGVLRPVMRSKPGAIGATIIASVPLGVGIGMSMYGNPSTWDPGHWFAAVVVTLAFGAFYGGWLWEDVQESRTIR